MSVEKFFYEHPVFRFDEWSEWKKGHGAYSKYAIHTLLQHYLKSGRLLRIRRELYAVIPPNASAEDVHVDPYLIAAKATTDSILGYHTALELLGVAYSSSEQFTFLSEQKAKSFQFQDRLFHRVAMPVNLVAQHKIMFEVDNINRQGVDIKITSLERTFVDILNRVELSGGWEEVVRSINSIALLNIDRVINYCLLLNNSILTAKVGYFLERRVGAFAPTTEELNKLLKHKPLTPQYGSTNKSVPCQLVKKWNILLPIHVLNVSWEEPEYDV